MKYAYLMCDGCRRKISKATRAALKRRRAEGGPPAGRPRKPLDPRVLSDVRHGKLTIAEAAKKLKVSNITVWRRMRELYGW